MVRGDLTRLPNWRAELAAYMASVAPAKFKPGTHDCALFVAGAVKAMTGVDFAKGFRGYRSLKAGAEKLKKHGYSDHIEYAAHVLSSVPVLMAQVGDVAVVEGDEGDALGVVQGPNVYVLRLDGLAIVPLVLAKGAFKV